MRVLNLFSLVVLVALAGLIWLGQKSAGDAPAADAVTEDAPVPDAPPVIEDTNSDDVSADDGAAEPEDAASDADTGEAPDASADEAVDAPVDAEPVDAADVSAGRFIFDFDEAMHGYFIAAEPVELGSVVFENLEVSPPMPECDDPGGVFLRLYSADETGPSYTMTIDSATITEDGMVIMATHADLGGFTLTADFNEAGMADYASGVDSIGELAVASVTLGAVRADNVPLSFWIGD